MVRRGLCLFDAYGTLFDISAPVREAALAPEYSILTECWQALAQDWRQKQLEYSWLRTLTDCHCDFWQVTCDALDWALERRGLNAPNLRARLLGFYRNVALYGDVLSTLDALKRAGFELAILSNGSPKMLEDAARSGGIEGFFSDMLSVESAGAFKPHRKVYDLVGVRFHCLPHEVLFVSANGWDAASGAGYGFETIWLNRTDAPKERLAYQPAHIVESLEGVIPLAKRKADRG